MFVSKNDLQILTRLILFIGLLWFTHAQAQQGQQEPEAAADRRVERLGETATEEWEMDLRLPSAAPVATQDKQDLVLPDEEQDQQLKQLLSRLAANPGDKNVLAQLNTLLSDVLAQANGKIDAGAAGEAKPLLALIQSVDPGLAGFGAARQRLKLLEATDELIKAGDAALMDGRVMEPADNSALYYFELAAKKDPRSEAAQRGLARVQKSLIDNALESARELDFETADNWLQQASAVSGDQEPVETARLEVAEFRAAHAAELKQQVIDAMEAGNFDLADFGIIDLIALGGQEEEVKSLLARLQEARIYGGYEPGQVISDELASGGSTPQWVIIDAGSFLMGSRGAVDNGDDHEQPRHRVVIKRGFGLGVTEVTVAEFRQFIERTGYRTAADINGQSSIYDEMTGRLTRRSGVNWKHDYRGKEAEPELPVLHVNVNDAQAYLQWLSLETGKTYRLPSEAEYEYVARAGGNSTYWWGEGSPAAVVENLTGERDRSPTKREWTTFFKKYGDGYWGPAPAGSLVSPELQHPMGVHDIAGNVSEWTADCWHDNYVKAPTDGSAWFNRGCERRVVRGGYWASAPEQSRAAYRFPVNAGNFGPVVGFRIARDL
jgi:formylglycine-generating enzyme required for sulfatase activity